MTIAPTYKLRGYTRVYVPTYSLVVNNGLHLRIPDWEDVKIMGTKVEKPTT